MEPTRSAWVVVAAHFRATGAKVVMIAPEQSADLRNYYKKHTKNDRLDSLRALLVCRFSIPRGSER